MTKEEITEILTSLRSHFPKVFPEKSVVILKKGIDLDICKSHKISINRTKLRKFLRIYTRSSVYIKMHIEGASRYDLDGNIIGTITDKDANSFSEMITEYINKRKFFKEQKQKHTHNQKLKNISKIE